MRRRTRIALALTTALAAAAPGAGADAEFDRGEALYANHCGGCHTASVHAREGRRVDSRETLRDWVASWSVHAGVHWGEEDIESVTRYLSRRLYGFTR